MRAFLARHQPQQPLRTALAAGTGAAIAIALAAVLSASGPHMWLMAPFGASCVLLFYVPSSPLSQPANVIGGHLVSTLTGLTLRLVLPETWWALALAVGLAIALMGILRVTHPPAGADPLIVFATDPGFAYLLFPVLSGSCLMVSVAWGFHRLNGTPFPLRKN